MMFDQAIKQAYIFCYVDELLQFSQVDWIDYGIGSPIGNTAGWGLVLACYHFNTSTQVDDVLDLPKSMSK